MCEVIDDQTMRSMPLGKKFLRTSPPRRRSSVFPSHSTSPHRQDTTRQSIFNTFCRQRRPLAVHFIS
ncbi:hypothetical protein BST61_g1714 [Cercospora zeina]